MFCRGCYGKIGHRLFKLNERYFNHMSLKGPTEESVLNSLEKDELIKRVLAAEAEAKALQHDAASVSAELKQVTAQRDAIAAERDALSTECNALTIERDALTVERDTLTVERDTLTIERDTLKGELAFLYTITTDGLKALQKRFNRKHGVLFDFDTVLKLELKEQVKFILNQAITLAKTNTSWANRLFGVSSEHNPRNNPKPNSNPKPDSDPAEDIIQQARNSNQQVYLGVKSTMAVLVEAALNGELTREQSNILLDSICVIINIADQLEEPDEEKEPRKGGKRKVRRDYLPERKSKNKDKLPDICPKCHSKVISLGKIRNLMISLDNALDKIFKRFNFEVELGACTNCKEVFAVYEKDPSVVPVTPYSVVPFTYIIDTIKSIYLALPMNRHVKQHSAFLGLGNDTIARNYAVTHELYLKPLCAAISRCLFEHHAWTMDETEMDVFSAMGKGSASDGTKTSNQTYILQFTTPAGDGLPVVVYAYLKGRSGKDILETINEFTGIAKFREENPEKFNKWIKNLAVCIDGYNGYNKFFKEYGLLPNVQRCMAHFRRKIIEELQTSGLVNILKGKTDQEIYDYCYQACREKSPLMILAAMLYAVSRVFVVERMVDRGSMSQEEYYAELLAKRQQYSRPLMESIIKLAEELTVLCSEPDKDGKMQLKSSSVGYKVCTFYKQCGEQLTTFLNVPWVPITQSASERAIRPITLHKRACGKNSVGGCEHYCQTMTIVGTFFANGGTNLQEYLGSYLVAAFDHCLKCFAKDRFKAQGIPEEGENWEYSDLPNNTDFQFEKYMKSFDVTPWLPGNYKEKNPLDAAVLNAEFYAAGAYFDEEDAGAGGEGDEDIAEVFDAAEEVFGQLLDTEPTDAD